MPKTGQSRGLVRQGALEDPCKLTRRETPTGRPELLLRDGERGLAIVLKTVWEGKQGCFLLAPNESDSLSIPGAGSRLKSQPEMRQPQPAAPLSPWSKFPELALLHFYSLPLEKEGFGEVSTSNPQISNYTYNCVFH